MEQYRYHKAYTPNKRSESISDTVEFSPKTFRMPQMSSIYAYIQKSNPSAVPPRVPVRGSFQDKLKQVNQERTQMKIAFQSNPFANEKPMRVPIVEA